MPAIPDAVTGATVPASWGDAVAEAINGLVGAILPYAGATAPAGYLLCNGQAVSRTAYADLFAVCSTTYGPGDGSTTFNVPDLRGRFPLGTATAGTGSTRGGVGGALGHSHTGAAHTHTGPSHQHTSSAHTHTGAAHTHTGPSHAHETAYYMPTSLRMGMAVPWGQGAASSITGGVRTADMTDDTASTRTPTLTNTGGTGNTGSTTPVAGGSTTPADVGAGGTGATGSTTPTAGGTADPAFLSLSYIIRAF